MHRRLAVSAALILAATPARADDPPKACPKYRPGAPVTPDAVACAPRPDQAAGHRVPPPEGRERPKLVRAAEPLQRGLVRGLLAPVRLALWAEDRYHVAAHARDATWSEDRTVGVSPIARWEGGKSLSAGAGFVDRDLAGAALGLRATAGTAERLHLEANLESADLLLPVRLETGVRYRDVASAAFWGYGDASKREASAGMMVDPIDQGGRDTQFSQREAIARARLLWPTGGGVTLGAGGSLRRARYGPPRTFLDEDPAIDDVYDVEALPGWDGVDAARAEASIRIDRRRTRDELQSLVTPSAGWIGQLYGGWQEGIGDDPTRFGYGGLDALGLLDLYNGDRVLSLRITIDAAIGPLDRIPFNELPTLGGSQALRGWETNRFRDRWAAATALEYSWPVTKGLSGFAFVDAGRVARVPDALLDEVPRFGGGAGAQVFTSRSLVARAWVAGSEEDVILRVELEPAFGRRTREVGR